jgi:hypothetical protein
MKTECVSETSEVFKKLTPLSAREEFITGLCVVFAATADAVFLQKNIPTPSQLNHRRVISGLRRDVD